MRRPRRTRAIITSIGVTAIVGAVLTGAAATPSAAAPNAGRAAPKLGNNVPSDGRAVLPRLHAEHVIDPAGLARQKAEAAAYAAAQPGAADTAAVGTPPTQVRSYNGVRESNSQPSDSTSAIGPTSHIELINTDFAIYNRTSNTPTHTGTLLDITGCVTSLCTDDVFDPQIIWDGQTNRFYYVADDIDGSSNYLSFGFSRTATPGSNINTDWCRYNVNYGTTFPDYPKLGDSANFALIGVNDFASNGSFVGSDLVGISKPAAGTTCPAASTFGFGIGSNLKVQGGGSQAFTPVPANQTDANPTGWAVARTGSIPAAGSTSLQLYKITKGGTGNPVFQTTGSAVPVPAYKVPADVPQPGTADTLDSSDTRPTQAVSAIDPLHGNKVGIWTQHTALGGAGAQVRWYEIDPLAKTLLQSGTVTGSSFVFNGAISPDRVVKGATKAFGGNMLLTVNQGSKTAKVGVYVVSKKGAAAQSAPVLVKLSANIDQGFGSGCSGSCRWGDYAGASPDPGAATGNPTGAVWITSMYNGASNPSGANWATWNAAYRP